MNLKICILVVTACLFATSAHGQSLREIVSGLGKEAAKAVIKKGVTDIVTEQAGVGTMGGDPGTSPTDQFSRSNWNNPQFTPPRTGDGYSHIRFGTSSTGPYKFAVFGDQTCDGAILRSVLTQVPMKRDKVDFCTTIESSLQKKARDPRYQQTPRPDWVSPELMVEQRRQALNVMPLKLYFRLGLGQLTPMRTPEGVYFDFAFIGSHGLVGTGSKGASDELVDITLHGPDVVYEWDHYHNGSGEPKGKPSRRKNPRGIVRVFTAMDANVERVLGIGAQNHSVSPTSRNNSFDTVYYTIHSVKRAAPILGDRPHYLVEISLDKLSFSLDAMPGPPTRVLNLK